LSQKRESSILARTLGELAAEFGCELIGDPSATVSRVATLSGAGDGHISFCASDAYREMLLATRATAVILRPDDAGYCPVASLVADNPQLIYARIATALHPEPNLVVGVHPSATVAESATISSSAEISANATVCDEAHVGDGVYVGPGAVVGPRCRLGKGSRILANATLVQDVTLGERCIIHPATVIGSDGFGNVQGEDGWEKLPHIGGVQIGDDVEIGANTTVDRGALDDTIIGNGVRIDNLVQIAHNVRIGDHTAIAAQVGIAGSTVVGQRCRFAGQAGVVGHIKICDDVIVAGKTVVSKNITEPGFYAGSIPGEPHKEWKRKVARFRRLGDLNDRVAALEKLAAANSQKATASDDDD
jgi:UDP-3-O-[3-hydroxymyristoyl] glucosamine N-acyltransferase